VTVLVPKGRDIVDRDAWVFRRETEGIRGRRSPGTPSRTTIEDSVVDLCAEADQTQGGEVTLRYGWPDVTERACGVAWQVAAILRSRGWQDEGRRCPRCQEARDADLSDW
jgi:hypothetical protein